MKTRKLYIKHMNNKMVAMHMARYTNEEKLSNQFYKQQDGSHAYDYKLIKKQNQFYKNK